jgi:hypothetical protein
MSDMSFLSTGALVRECPSNTYLENMEIAK